MRPNLKEMKRKPLDYRYLCKKFIALGPYARIKHWLVMPKKLYSEINWYKKILDNFGVIVYTIGN